MYVRGATSKLFTDDVITFRTLILFVQHLKKCYKKSCPISPGNFIQDTFRASDLKCVKSLSLNISPCPWRVSPWQQHYYYFITGRNTGNVSDNVSHLSQSGSRCSEEDNNTNNKNWNVGCQSHHPTNHLSPCWVRTTTILHWLVAHEAEYQDQLTSHKTSSQLKHFSSW